MRRSRALLPVPRCRCSRGSLARGEGRRGETARSSAGLRRPGCRCPVPPRRARLRGAGGACCPRLGRLWTSVSPHITEPWSRRRLPLCEASGEPRRGQRRDRHEAAASGLGCNSPELFGFRLHGRVAVGVLVVMFLFLCGYRRLLLTARNISALLPQFGS